MVRLQLVGSEKQKGESCIGKEGSELPLQLSRLPEGVVLDSHVQHMICITLGVAFLEKESDINTETATTKSPLSQENA